MIGIEAKDGKLLISLDREKFMQWLRGEAIDPLGALWEGNDESQKEGYKAADGTHKEFPSDTHVEPSKEKNRDGIDTTGEPVEGVDLFEVGPNGIGGKLQDAENGKDKIKELRDWLKKNRFNYRNFCLFLYNMKELAGWPLSTPLIGVTAKKEPTIFQVATRFHSYWLSAKDEIAKQYKTFLRDQLEDLGVTIRLVEEVLDGEEIDPKDLPQEIRDQLDA